VGSRACAWTVTRAKWLAERLRLPKVWHFIHAWHPAAPVALGLLSVLLTSLTFRLSSADATWALAFKFFTNPLLFLLNWLPVALWVFLCYFTLGKPCLAFGVAAAPVLLLALVNYYKLRLRGDPLMFADLSLLGEASAMSKRYAIQMTAGVTAALLLTLLALVLLRFQYRRWRKPALGKRLLGCSVCAALLAFSGNLLITDDALYSQTALAVSWLPTQSYIEHGVVYPFLRSVNDAMEQKPDGYHEDEAAQALSAYAQDDIPATEKVDIIGVMMEAFNDFSTFDNLDFIADPYTDWHALEAESVSGTLVTNVFAGETVNTERAFLTGYLDPSDSFRAPVNSFVWYLRGQGYTCVGNHPGYNWFYNRLNVNEYLGFERYRFYEDTYHVYAPTGILKDSVFLPTVVADYNLAAKSGNPVFSFNVTYQNHGPYDTVKRYQTPYLAWKAGYNQADYCIANNYLDGVAQTGRQLRQFVEHFRAAKRPVVIVLFGDHNPWWGDDNSAYQMFNVDLDRSTEQGFFNYYSTPYLIWANDAAKQALHCDFTGEGGRISPAFLMDRLFTLAGWQGPAYLKALRELETHTSVINRQFVLDGDQLTGVGDSEPSWLKDFRKLEYYEKHSAVPAA